MKIEATGTPDEIAEFIQLFINSGAAALASEKITKTFSESLKTASAKKGDGKK